MRNTGRLKIKCLLTILIVIVATMFFSCSKKEDEQVFESLSQIDGHNMGCMSGSIFDELIQEKFPNSEITYFASRSELLLGLSSGKIDGFISDEPVAMMMLSINDSIKYLDEEVGYVEYGVCFSDESKEVLKQFNEYLNKIETNNHLKELVDKWINPSGTSQKKKEYTLTGVNGTLNCVTTPDAAPFSFMADNVFQGFEVELLYEFCNEYGYDLEINTVSFDALLTSVATGKYDLAFNGIFITQERAKSVNFSTPTYQGRDVVIVRSSAVKESKSLIEYIKDSFYKNFIEEDRYQLLFKGALTTLEISLISIVLGTLYGLLIYVLSSMNKTSKKIIDTIQKVLAKLPAVVLLMLLFYVVFKSSNIKANIVSIIGFSFLFAHTFYGLLKTGVASIDYGQSEAAMALGYERWVAFFHVILPQALKTVSESYLGEIISLIKNTSIVGYVSVSDLTRMSDIIRGRTYDALFPLIVVAIIYYLLCSIVVYLLRIPLNAYINKKVNYHD